VIEKRPRTYSKGGFGNKFEKGFQRGVRKEIGKNSLVV
jgi:hypothetical protein